jgi:hypothetical protein
VVFQWVYHHDRGGGEEAHSPWEEACGTRRLRRSISPSVGFSYRYLLGCNSPMECRQTRTRNSPRKFSWPWRLSLMKECRVSHSVWRELNKWFPSILGNCLVFKSEPRNKCMCMKAHWKVFGVWSREEPVNKEILAGNPSSKWFTHGCAKGFWGEWERQR